MTDMCMHMTDKSVYFNEPTINRLGVGESVGLV